MDAIRTDSDEYELSTHVTADRGEFHVGIDAGAYRVADADIRPSASGVELTMEVARGHHSPGVRVLLVEAVFDIDVRKTRRKVIATLPIGDVDLLHGVSLHCVDVRTWVAGSSCILEGTLRG